jgi:hypothetical protein
MLSRSQHHEHVVSGCPLKNKRRNVKPLAVWEEDGLAYEELDGDNGGDYSEY